MYKINIHMNQKSKFQNETLNVALIQAQVEIMGVEGLPYFYWICAQILKVQRYCPIKLLQFPHYFNTILTRLMMYSSWGPVFLSRLSLPGFSLRQFFCHICICMRARPGPGLRNCTGFCSSCYLEFCLHNKTSSHVTNQTKLLQSFAEWGAPCGHFASVYNHFQIALTDKQQT